MKPGPNRSNHASSVARSSIAIPQSYTTKLRVMGLDAQTPDSSMISELDVDLSGRYAEGFYLYETAENIDVLNLSDVESANIGDIIETIKATRRQHLLVVEPTADETTESIRGIFSTSHIANQLGIKIDVSDQASTFAEFKKALAAS